MNDDSKEFANAFLSNPFEIEADFARSAWYDKSFALWFAPLAKQEVMYLGKRASQYFALCGEFVRNFKCAPAQSSDTPEVVFASDPDICTFFKEMQNDFKPLPGGATCKPTAWQKDKARRYLASRYDTLLAEQLNDAKTLRDAGQTLEAEQVINDAKHNYIKFFDSTVSCVPAFDNLDDIVSLADDNPPLFVLDGELGKLLNARLKPDNLGVFLADPKVGKTTVLVSMAMIAARHVPTLFIGAGDESLLKYNGRFMTNLTCKATQCEHCGTYAMPIPDCQHNADGTCPIAMSGEPRQNKQWQDLIKNGASPADLCDGITDGSKTLSGNIYAPCCRCFPLNNGTDEDRTNRRNWQSAIWWRKEEVKLGTRIDYEKAKRAFDIQAMKGGLRVAAYANGTLTVDGIRELLDSLDSNENFVPRVIVIDYADILKQEMGRSTDKDNDGMRRIWEGLRAISSSLSVLVLTATQTNRLSEECETQTRRTIGRSAKAADNCTWFCSINQTVVERRAKVMRVSVMYAREGAFDPEYQAMCCQWHEMQDGFAFSEPVFRKIKAPAPYNS